MIERTVFVQILKDLKYFPVIGIIGPRQVGKTTLAGQIRTHLGKSAIYLDLELESHRRRLEDAETYLRSLSNESVIIDEVQRLPHLFPLLRALIDENRRPARFVILGSASPELIHGSAESLAGRIAYTELMPFSTREIIDLFPLETHWIRGGFPPALLAPDLKVTWRWLGNFIETFVMRDLQELGQEISRPLLRRILSMLTHIHGAVLNYSELSRSLGVSMPTVKRYIDLLEGSFILRRLAPFHTNLGKRLVKAPKVYFRDTGILHFLAGVRNPDQLRDHIIIGASWEGYVIEEIYRHLPVDWQYFYYRTHAGAESDLILISPDHRRICVEIKHSNAPVIQRGYYQSLSDLKPDFQYVIIPDGERYIKKDELVVCNLREFLLKELQMLIKD